ncbi:tRNA (adenosine(37)-N6)-threonylcarbamoyltransferase complex ATPase subunit type 1 TsaE [Mesorhizobium sp. CAU 1732]|uniref:tRNA (adenosine(37)-N6)-threonylcarbamoyltransferase complex ATPase subunit type 1 TsaE n=1 Tax=Mesorhizobium sp. CAU 1732 TaxID=3140358 RepID=UPI003260E553
MTSTLLRLELPDEDASRRLGEDIAMMLARGDVVALDGDLGMGKTTLARAIIRAMAGDDDLDVPSPTFTLVQVYEGRIPIQHFDLYRLTSPDELDELGFAEAIEQAAVLIEWPQRAAGAMPSDAVTIALSEHGDGRIVSISGPEAFMERLQRSLALRAFVQTSGFEPAKRRFLVGDASSRAYETISAPGREPLILMNAPRRPDGPPIRDGKPYSQIAHLAEDVTPFVAIAKVLRDAGLAAPEIPAADLDQGMLLVENLGSDGVLDASGVPIAERYIAAAELLAAMHTRRWPSHIDLGGGVIHQVPAYDHGAMAIETELLTDWYLPHVAGRPASEAERRNFAGAWSAAFDRLDHAEKSLVLRDYHSPNLIWRGDKVGHDRIGLIDFQDAMIGPAAYDVASLAMDARVTIPPELERRIVDAYCAAREASGSFDRAAFEEAYAIMAAQRNSKILGIFVRLNVRDGKPGYMKHLPRIRDYVSRALSHPSLRALRDFYASAGIIGAAE